MKRIGLIVALLVAVPEASAQDARAAQASDPQSTSRFLTNRADLAAAPLSIGDWSAASVAGPEVRRFEVTLNKGEFAAVGIKQLDGNVVATAFDPAGKIIAVEDRSARGGAETVAWTSEAAGRYAIQIAMFEWDAPEASFEIALTSRARAGRTPDEIAQQLFQAWHAEGFPGAALMVLDRGKVRLQRVAGLARVSPARAIDAKTRFDLASVSKQFTGLAVAILAARGQIDLDADVRAYLPEVPDFGARITIRHLLSHTSGLRDWDVGLGLAGRPIEAGITLDEILAFVSRQRALNFSPGSEQSYANVNYNLLAAIVARRSGVPFERFLHDQIFAPAGMTARAVADPQTEIAAMAQSFQGRYPQPQALSLRPMAALGSSSVYASLEDMAAWVRTLSKARREIENGSAGAVWPPFLARGSKSGDADYAFGLWRGARNGTPFLGHLGLAAGYRVSFRWFPERDLAVVYMTNDGGDIAYDRGRRIENLYLGAPPPPVEIPDAQYEPAKQPSIETASRYAGEYRSAELATAYEIVVANARLVARHPINGDIVLEYRGGDSFSSSYPYMPSIRFRQNAKGEIDAMIVSAESARDLVFLKDPPPR